MSDKTKYYLKWAAIGAVAGFLIFNRAMSGRFSMFLPAPILSTILLVILCLPGTQKLIIGSENQS